MKFVLRNFYSVRDFTKHKAKETERDRPLNHIWRYVRAKTRQGGVGKCRSRPRKTPGGFPPRTFLLCVSCFVRKVQSDVHIYMSRKNGMVTCKRMYTDRVQYD